MRTIRIIVYDGPEAWMKKQRSRDLQTPYTVTGAEGHARIISINATEYDIMGGVLPPELEVAE